VKAPLTAEQVARLLGTQPTQDKPTKKLTHGVLLNPPLPDEAVRDIRRRWAVGDRLKDIAGDHNVTKAAVSLIGSGQRRKDVQ
jgi:hypothetical protein